MTKTILVSGASGVVGYGILRSLQKNKPDIKLIGTTIYDDSIAPAFCDIFEKAPLTSDDNYIDWLNKTILKHQVDMIIPGIDADMIKWNQERQQIDNKTKPLLNSPSLIELCSDKWLFYEKLNKTDSTLAIETSLVSNFNELKEKFGLPFLLKPRKGFASKGIVIVNSEEDFLKHQTDIGGLLMAQPLIGNDDSEYTISAFFDNNSNLCCRMGLRRKLSKEGYTEKAVVDTPAGANEAIQELGDLLKPIGPTNFQFRVHNDELKLLEINPRISSSTSIRTAFGYNESMMSVEYFLDNKLPVQPEIKTGHAVRYIEDYIFYDSSTI